MPGDAKIHGSVCVFLFCGVDKHLLIEEGEIKGTLFTIIRSLDLELKKTVMFNFGKKAVYILAIPLDLFLFLFTSNNSFNQQ